MKRNKEKELALLKEAMLSFPKGTEIKSVYGTIGVVKGDYYVNYWKARWVLLLLFLEGSRDAVIVYDGEHDKWAEVIEKEPLFYTEDFEDGSFPVNSCSNCKYEFNTYCNNYDKTKKCKTLELECWDNWKGELKGDAIYKGDKCWKVGYFNGTYVYKYDTWDGQGNPYFRYFSNERNAEEYYKNMLEERGIEIADSKEYKAVRLQKDGKDIAIECHSSGVDLTPKTAKYLMEVAENIIDGKEALELFNIKEALKEHLFNKELDALKKKYNK